MTLSALTTQLTQTLSEIDGKAVTLLSEAEAKFGSETDYAASLIGLIAHPDGHICEGATWLIKSHLEAGKALSASETEALVARLQRVEHWASALHLFQVSKQLALTPQQATKFGDVAKAYLTHKRPFLRAWSAHALCHAADAQPALRPAAHTAFHATKDDPAASVRARARHLKFDWFSADDAD